MQQPQYEGRQVVTFHNQRDFIFIRHHRYIYKQEEDTDITNKKVTEEIKSAIKSKKTSKNMITNQKKLKNNGKHDDENIKTRAKLQELGPRFTLKLKWLQDGIFDSQYGEYEWIQGKRNQMRKSKRKFFL